jgi:hypothetical protein
VTRSQNFVFWYVERELIERILLLGGAFRKVILVWPALIASRAESSSTTGNPSS